MSDEILNCPVCKDKQLVPFSWNQTTVDVCGRCYGIWFDFWEMKKVADSASLAAVDAAFEGEYRESAVETLEQKSCPVDATPLERHEWGEDSRIVMDYCPLCSGTWLDAGELEGYTDLLKKLEEAPEKLDEIAGEVAQASEKTRQEIEQWAGQVDMGFMTPLIRVVGAIQRKLGLG